MCPSSESAGSMLGCSWSGSAPGYGTAQAGIYYGLFILLEMGIGKKGMKKIPAVIRHLFNKIIIVVGFGIFYCTDGITKLGNLFLGLMGLGNGGLSDALLTASLRNNLFLLLAALLCCFPILELPKKWMQKSAGAYVFFSITGTVLAAALFLLSSILLVDATNMPFLYTKF